MFLLRSQSGGRRHAFLLSIVLLVSGCGPARYAYYQSQATTFEHQKPGLAVLTASTDTLPRSADLSEALARPVSDEPGAVAEPIPSVSRSASKAGLADEKSSRHRNPDSYQGHRFSRLLGAVTAAHVAPKSHQIDRHSTSRKTYKPALIALGLAVLSFGLLFVPGGTTMAWVLAVSVPLSATLLGVASLTTINRNKEHYRGKGWAMGAILLGTGVLGLALVAMAALSISKIVWER
ncbi:hypothetical protein HNV11_19320 [Spirosoma taeanense]|uniref:DUF4190 domain-containing protein n=1 Tax=Spirosoma taeanense TaxID=2735870 RepID=A0A6M5YDK1_9BACT|nr:hypothetical protein [Spirosoma taeanense]QJW91373.1 hypothetical protein HNV11_19320 [Spirosoma taeanense]